MHGLAVVPQSFLGESFRVIEQLKSKGLSNGVLCLDGSNARSVALSRKSPKRVLELVESSPPLCHKFESGALQNTIVFLYDSFRRGNYHEALMLLPIRSYQELVKVRDLLPPKILSDFFRAVVDGNAEFIASWLDKNRVFDVNLEEPIPQCMPLHEAVEREHLEIVDLLISANADPFAQNLHGRIPRELLPAEMGPQHKEILRKLTQYEQKWVEREFAGTK
jgi:hypothetical protein